MELKCCLCLHHRIPEDSDGNAITIINGQAVCYQHMGYVQGGQFTRVLGAIKEGR